MNLSLFSSRLCDNNCFTKLRCSLVILLFSSGDEVAQAITVFCCCWSIFLHTQHPLKPDFTFIIDTMQCPHDNPFDSIGTSLLFDVLLSNSTTSFNLKQYLSFQNDLFPNAQQIASINDDDGAFLTNEKCKFDSIIFMVSKTSP